MKRILSLNCLAFTAALAASLASCSFIEDAPAGQTSHLFACSSISVRRAGVSSYPVCGTDHLDIFVYDAESGLLDSYSRTECAGGIIGGDVPVNSSTGDKIVVITANLPTDCISYQETLSYESLCSLKVSLYKESPEFPLMCGSSRIKAGTERTASVTLTPLCARVRIRSLLVDFSRRSYSRLKLTDIRAYLINVNAECGFADTEQIRPATDIINCGRLDESCVGSMDCPSMVLSEEPGPGTLFHCFPCEAGEDGVCAATMLVIEGKVDGNVCYYPIPVGDGVVRPGVEYIYDIEITRVGGKQPDVPIEEGVLQAGLEVKNWYEYPWEYVDF